MPLADQHIRGNPQFTNLKKDGMGNDMIGEPTSLKYKNGGKQLIFDIFQVIKSLRFQNISQIARSRLD